MYKITISGILSLFIAMVVLSCTEQPSRTNPYDPEVSSPPYTITGKIYTEGKVSDVSSFSLILKLEKLGAEEPTITPVAFNNTEIFKNVSEDILKINWVDTESPIELSSNDTLLTVKWEANEPLEDQGINIWDYMFVDSETGEVVDKLNLNSKVRVE